MTNEITLNEVGGTIYVVYADTMEQATFKCYEVGEEAKAWKCAERVAKMAGRRVAAH